MSTAAQVLLQKIDAQKRKESERYIMREIALMRRDFVIERVHKKILSELEKELLEQHGFVLDAVPCPDEEECCGRGVQCHFRWSAAHALPEELTLAGDLLRTINAHASATNSLTYNQVIKEMTADLQQTMAFDGVLDIACQRKLMHEGFSIKVEQTAARCCWCRLEEYDCYCRARVQSIVSIASAAPKKTKK